MSGFTREVPPTNKALSLLLFSSWPSYPNFITLYLKIL
ncbi:hypothetical protein B4064_2549 [Caldibacillus thermoamylovorans]|uniref:Uncharacterized protein n=1 Tax=Caldibacillus thermoamylovorans TaxID=35841 RepID=A0A0D0EKC5_9BACI|nr:hypothetical protein B4065_3478 [Caldibacillus thermoamylovorans]KIO65678.1 hypothetical protein B4064_2549 [Caldibacillus thermoamylovorans]KIO66079.1 hypothetical protein B4166_1092 [Caldibacillus thermoamylovorans]KIO72504.1 hypothetical protein B4167_1194 [Caldibacillus thermoamylovorans]